ncbi:hypothetical protein DAPPUDRAFT_238932 [Daphnia pulex]|uniref:Uncharacterized protein n=1 Tax=Daphnia pulex TaxID=6669 RepID=E9G7U4_DAPPU|nr:hypothetical protein DAPPUDRAFT_238932 [Daphnia pulex]|eukprot:EFX84598.1 hypothetical protein DAPPUDRAFT_238932 [Daphnia pulex]
MSKHGHYTDLPGFREAQPEVEAETEDGGKDLNRPGDFILFVMVQPSSITVSLQHFVYSLIEV